MIYVVGGGNPLNFKVVGGTSAPASPKENTIWINTNTDVSSWDFSATEPYRRSKNKNLIVYPFCHTTKTENGITFTDNNDGTVTVNGTATADTFFRPHKAETNFLLELDPGTYTVSDAAGTSNGRVELLGSYDNQTTWSTFATCANNGKATFTITKKAIVRASIKVYKGKTYNNLVFKPQLEKGSTTTSFVKGDATGQAWISTGAVSTAPFNALKKNNITVCPVSVNQYINGAWADKTAKAYQNSAWVDVKVPGFYIFKSGEGALVSMKHMSGRNCSITPSADSIVYYTQSTGDLGEVSTTETAVSFAGYTTVNARAKSTFYPGGSAPCLGLVSTLPGSYSKRPDIASVEFTSDSVERVYSLPLPAGLDGAYIMIGGNFSGEVYDIWLE